MNSGGGDSFISDDEEELCPLCVEEMDISDKNFKPCPCGYQVCQFCYNNIRQNPQLNGKCPACRRPYSDDAVEYRMITPEEWKQDQLRQNRKEKERKQRERERKETESISKNKQHLSGMRVIQKNLVYVIGLNPNIPTEELHNTLRGDQFFGQYGKIQKIVINRRTNANGHPGIGVYVTFARKEDALRCIQAVDGSINDGKYLRAAFGTTKYCSAYLRGQQCPNPNCMFLHEPGDDADSVSRQDLSTIQHAARGGGGSRSVRGSTPRASSEDHETNSSANTSSATETSATSADSANSALPATASWAHKMSPPSSNQRLSSPSPIRAKEPTQNQTVQQVQPQAQAQAQAQPVQKEVAKPDPVLELFKESLSTLSKSSFQYSFSSALLNEKDLENSSCIPPFFTFSLDQSKIGKDLPDFKSVFAGLMSTPRENSASSTDLANQAASRRSAVPTTNLMDGATPGAPGANVASTATPPPPGLFSAAHRSSPSQGSTQDRQVLLAQLMNGGKSK